MCQPECVQCVPYCPILALPEAKDTFYIHLVATCGCRAVNSWMTHSESGSNIGNEPRLNWT